jgi:DNA-binding response OmpR family regulator
MTDNFTVVAFESDDQIANTLRVLRRQGRLFVERSVQRALHAIEAERPEVVIVDAANDEAHAARFVRALRTLPLSGEFRILLLINHCDIGSHRFGLRAGADTTLCRPFTGDELVSTVRCLVAAKTDQECLQCGGTLAKASERHRHG